MNMATKTNGTAKTVKSERAHILSLQVRNVKTLREVVIDDFGEVLEIRGDTGQGKTSILESIEAGLRGMDSTMVRRGESQAEIVLELDSARIQRIVPADGGRETLTVTDTATGKPIDKGKAFLAALLQGTAAFRPLEFVEMGKGDTNGRTERLRKQRNLLLDAMPVKLSAAEVMGAIGELGEDVLGEANKVNVDGVDWGQHGLGICAALEKTFYDSRKQVNADAELAEGALVHVPPPARVAPKRSAVELQGEWETAQQALADARAQARAAQGAEQRRAFLSRAIETALEKLPPKGDLVDALGEARAQREELLARHRAKKEQLARLQQEIAEIEEKGRKAGEEIAAAEGMVREWELCEQQRAELESLGPAGGGEGGTRELEDALQLATEMLQARNAQDRHDAAARAAMAARERAVRFDKLVELFRDTLPRRIVEAMEMPVEGLGIAGGVVCFKGIPLHQLGTSEQLRIAVILAGALNPKTGFVLVDRAESLGSKDRLALVAAAQECGLQLVLTYVDSMALPSAGVVVMAGGERVS